MNKSIYDVAVFGGGVIGSSIFNALVKSGYNVVLIEKGLDLAVGATKANSAIVHAGYDAEPNTLKAMLNVEGNKMFPSMCKRLGLPLKKIGSYVIGDNVKAVNDLYNKGKINGVKNLKVLNKKQLQKKLPNLSDNITYGLICKNSFVVSPYLLTVCLAEEGVVNGGKVLLNFQTESIIKSENVFKISNGQTIIYANNIVNSCGSGYNDLAKLIGSEQYDITFKRGEYYVLDHSEKNLVPSTIFPLPSQHGKGILVTPTIDGNILVGPTSYLSDASTKTTSEGLKEISEKCKALINNVNLAKCIRNFSGIRTIVGNDFVIEKSKKVDNVINLAGICSPGLSSSPAIAKYVMKLLGFKYNINKKSIKIKPYTNLNTMSLKQKNALIKSNEDYGKIICKCENISKGEIIDAIHRPITPITTDAIKRRVRAGMGRCQGAFCLDRVINILATENNCELHNINKEMPNSEIIVANIKEVQ